MGLFPGLLLGEGVKGAFLANFLPTALIIKVFIPKKVTSPRIDFCLSLPQKVILLATLGALVFLFSFFPSQFRHSASRALGRERLHIYFFDVGQGDSALIVAPNGQSLLVDGGPDESVLDRLALVDSYWNRRIDYLLLTHPHADHLAGLISVLQTYKVGTVLWNNVAYDSPFVTAWVRQLGEFDGKIAPFERGDKLSLGEARVTALWPPAGWVSVENVNNVSIVLHLKYGDFDALFTGDLEGDAQELVSWPRKVEVLKVPHHGGAGDTSKKLLRLARPYLGVISVGENNYHQPAQSTLEILQKFHTTIHRTDEQGSLEVWTDGKVWGSRAF